jgi:hypothetical protein
MTWFRPKTHGYGATPVAWKGWLAVALFSLAQLILALALLSGDPGFWHVLAFLALSLPLTAWFVRFTRARTEGDWRWRWGREDAR